MANERVIIEIDVEDKELDTTISKLQKMGVVSENNAKKFKKSNAELKKTTKEAGGEVKRLSGLMNNAGAAIAGAFAVSTLVNFAKGVTDIVAEFEKLSAVLKTALGSESEAEKAFAMIQDFASSTPFSVRELTGAFVKLVNQGFKPTQKEMRNLGDLAASTGKDFDQLAEAIIDAQVGEMERLKEFGVRAAKEGDKVKFTFKGVTTEVQNTESAIRDYVVGLGGAEGVSGSMAAISETLGGKISNLGDAYDALVLKVATGEGSFSELSKVLLGDVTKGLNQMTDSSGEANKELSITGIFMKSTTNMWNLFLTILKAITIPWQVIIKLAGKLGEKMGFVGSITETVLGIFNRFTQVISALPKIIDEVVNLIVAQFSEIGNIIKAQMTLDFDLMGEIIERSKNRFKGFTKEALKAINGVEKATKATEDAARAAEEAAKKAAEAEAQRKADAAAAARKQAAIDEHRRNKELGHEKEMGNWRERVLDDLKKEEAARKKEEDEDIKRFNERNERRLRESKQAIALAKAEDKLQKDLAQEAEDERIRRIEDIEDIANAAVSINANASQAILNGELNRLEKQKEQGIITDKEYQAERKKILQKQAKQDKALALFDIAIATAVAIAKNAGNIPLQILAGATGAAQAAAVASQPIPQLRKGGTPLDAAKAAGMLRGATHERGGILIEAEGNEYLMPTAQSLRYRKELDDMRLGRFEIPKPNLHKEDSALFDDQNIVNQLKRGHKLSRRQVEALEKLAQDKHVNRRNSWAN